MAIQPHYKITWGGEFDTEVKEITQISESKFVRTLDEIDNDFEKQFGLSLKHKIEMIAEIALKIQFLQKDNPAKFRAKYDTCLIVASNIYCDILKNKL